MTDKKIYKYPRLTELASCFLGIFLFALMLRNSEVTIAYIKEGISLCRDTLIPALFPFMVVSELFVASGSAGALGAMLSKPMRFLFGINGDGAVAIVLGALSGFPIGALCAISLLERGRISKSECERLIAISSNPSSAFLISATGISLFGSREFGRALYAATLLSSLLVGILLNLVSKKGKKEAPQKEEARALNSINRRHIKASDLSSSIVSSAESMLKVCAFVVFFTAFVGVLCRALESFGASEELKATVCSLFELSGGVAKAASIRPIYLGGVIAAFAAGWSGISVHLQIATLCSGKNISLLPYFISKLICGILSAAIIGIYLKISPPTFYTDTPTALITPRGAYIISGVFLSAITINALLRILKHR